MGLTPQLESQVPEDPMGRRSGGALVWTAPESKELGNCSKKLDLAGPLLVVANWCPHHLRPIYPKFKALAALIILILSAEAMGYRVPSAFLYLLVSGFLATTITSCTTRVPCSSS